VRERISADSRTIPYEASVQWGEELMNIRTIGTSILKAAVRRASPEIEQWGTAMLNEMEAIENDWAAFRWALGSAAALFRGLEVRINDSSEIPGRLEHLQECTRRWQRAGYLVCFVVIGGFAYYFAIFPNIVERIGCALTILGSGFMAGQLCWNYVRRRAARSDSGSSAVIDQYRAVLQHRRDFHRGTWFWSRMIIFLPGPMLCMYGLRRADPGPGSLFVIIVFLVFAIMAIPLNLGLSRKFHREIERVDNLRKQI
jgi:hypothetical protein